MAYDRRGKQMKYIRDLPYLERQKLCIILNQNNHWEKLAVISFESRDINIKYDGLTIGRLSQERSPTDELLMLLSHGNNTILDLFKMLSKMQHYQAMEILRRFVGQEHHALIDLGEGNLQRLFGGLDEENANANDMKIDAQNFNHIEPAQANVSKMCVDRIDNDLETAKISNVSPESSTDEVPRDSHNNLTPSSSSSNVSSLLQPKAGTSKIKKGAKLALASS